MGILTPLRKKAVAVGLAGAVLAISFTDYLTRSNVDSRGSSAYAADRSRQENENEFLRNHPPRDIFSNNPLSTSNRTHNHFYNPPRSQREMQDHYIIQDGVNTTLRGLEGIQRMNDYQQRERYLNWLIQDQQRQQNNQNNQRQNNSWRVTGYLYNRYQDHDGDGYASIPNELSGWDKTSFYENEPMRIRFDVKNRKGSNLSFILYGPDNRRLHWDKKNIISDNQYNGWDLKALNKENGFLEANGNGMYTVAFFIDNECFNIRPFNWLKNRPVTTNPRIVAAPLPPPVILPQRTEEVGRYSSLLGYELKADNDARTRNVLIHKEDKNHDGDCKFWAGIILENRVGDYKDKDFGFSIYDSAGNRRAHWHEEIPRNWRSNAVGSIAEDFSFHDYPEGKYNLVVKWPNGGETSKIFYIRESNLLVR